MYLSRNNIWFKKYEIELKERKRLEYEFETLYSKMKNAEPFIEDSANTSLTCPFSENSQNNSLAIINEEKSNFTQLKNSFNNFKSEKIIETKMNSREVLRKNLELANKEKINLK